MEISFTYQLPCLNGSTKHTGATVKYDSVDEFLKSLDPNAFNISATVHIPTSRNEQLSIQIADARCEEREARLRYEEAKLRSSEAAEVYRKACDDLQLKRIKVDLLKHEREPLTTDQTFYKR